MQIETRFDNPDGTVSIVTYEDADSFESLDFSKITQVYAVCLLKGKMVIVFHGIRKTWSLVGGSVEPGESLEDCLKREIQEESNMKVLDFKPVGYQMVQTGDKIIYQLRYVCNVEPYGEFVSDPAGKITEIKAVDPKDYKQYFDWGEIGDRIVTRALEISK
ncbi:MAG: NUDIX domain-containing protein [Candidatus Zambryskibacteria bacterium]